MQSLSILFASMSTNNECSCLRIKIELNGNLYLDRLLRYQFANEILKFYFCVSLRNFPTTFQLHCYLYSTIADMISFFDMLLDMQFSNDLTSRICKRKLILYVQ